MIQGSCLCGSAKYEASGQLSEIVHCHCKTCRKAHGSAFSSVAAVPIANFTIQSTATISCFESSPGKVRYFCSMCGTQLYAKRDNNDHVILRLGSVDSELTTSEYAHIWLSEKANWYDLHSDLKEYQCGV